MIKICNLQIQNNICYYILEGCSDDEFVSIIEYKSWTLRHWDKPDEKKYFVFPYTYNRCADKFHCDINRFLLDERKKVLNSYIGYAPILIRYLQSLGYLVNGKENFRSKEINIGNTKYIPYDFQSNAIDAWLKNGCCGVIKMPTGSGKSFTACNIIQRMKVKTLITVHTNDLLINAWLNTLVEQFGEDIKSKIGIIGGGLSKDDRKNMRIISDMSYETNINQDIVIATSQSLVNKLDRLCNERFGLVVVDECHHYPSDQFSKVINNVRAPYRLGLSATLLRSDGTTPLIWGLLGDVCYRIGIKELVNKGVLVNPIFNTIIINDISAQGDIAKSGRKKLNLSRYVKMKSSSSIVKMRYILDCVEKLVKGGKKFVMYTDFVNSESSDVFTRDFYVDELIKKDIRVVGVSSDMSGTERSKVFTMLENGELDGLVFGLLGSEGVNIPRIDSVIMCNGTKSTIRYTQRVGRSMRVSKIDVNKKNAYIYELILNTPMERRWNNENFYEYEQEGYEKEVSYVN